MFVIGVAGQAQMGKDTLADRLQEMLNGWDKCTLEERAAEKDMPETWQRRAFAYAVKKVFADTFDVTFEFIEKWKVIPEPPPGFDMTVRQALQFIGDGFRKIRSTIWLDLAFRDKSRPTIISDVRYINEFLRVKKEGGLNFLVGRPDKLNDDPNGSEAQIRPFIEFALNHFQKKPFVLVAEELHRLATLEAMGGGVQAAPPEHMDAFDVFVRNDGTKEEFLAAIDGLAVPYIQQYVFEFPELETKEEEQTCLISS